MTNAMIILTESVKLMEKGVLESTGRQYKTPDGKVFDEPEAIHTFQAWKSLGYVVKRGEKAIAQFPVWKYTTKKVQNEETDEETETGSCRLRTASFFKLSQVEKIKEK